jgi:NADPH-dependent glutamate synthase beta subunit-like oxidoreductase
MCIDGIYTAGAAFCIHNPSTGREIELPQEIELATKTKNVAVIGGGPGGLEAARTLAEKGHTVTLFEANDSLGGQVNLATRSPRRRDLQGIIDWRTQELKRLGVTVKLNSYVEGSELAKSEFDVIIVATGGMPKALEIPGSQHVIESWDVLSGAKRLSGEVLIYDDHGGNQALDLAENLASSGAKVEFVTPERTMATDVGGMVASAYFKSLSALGVKFTVLRELNRIEMNSDGTFTAYLGMEDETWEERRVVTAVVAETGTTSISDVYDELVSLSSNGGEVLIEALINGKSQTSVRNPDGKFQLFRIGDAISSRGIHSAILDAARISRGI